MTFNNLRRNSIKAVALLALASVPKLVSGHSWVEQANRISPNGTLVGPAGYPPKWSGREPPFNDQAVTNPLRVDQTNLCLKQPIGEQVDGFPELIAAPGDFVALRYTENGHVTKLEPNRPLNGGVVYVYGTTDPRPNENIVDVHRKWTADGTGGDGRGRLLATRHYDDGQCYEANGEAKSVQRQQEFPKLDEQPYGPNLWCQTDFQIPDDIPQGSQYVVYWVWTWPLLVNNEGSESGEFRDFPPHAFPPGGELLVDEGIATAEVYSSCLSINVQGEPLVQAEAANVNNNNKFGTHRFIDNREDWNNAANRRQLETQFEVDVDGLPDADTPASGAPVAPPTDEQTPAPAPTTTGREGVKTVTLTAAPTTLLVTKTVTAGVPSAAPTDAPQGALPGPVQSVEPFLPQHRAVKRRRSSWSFGHNE